jgi:hypothetical protein
MNAISLVETLMDMVMNSTFIELIFRLYSLAFPDACLLTHEFCCA